jgi:hypothetical protein
LEDVLLAEFLFLAAAFPAQYVPSPRLCVHDFACFGHCESLFRTRVGLIFDLDVLRAASFAALRIFVRHASNLDGLTKGPVTHEIEETVAQDQNEKSEFPHPPCPATREILSLSPPPVLPFFPPPVGSKPGILGRMHPMIEGPFAA